MFIIRIGLPSDPRAPQAWPVEERRVGQSTQGWVRASAQSNACWELKRGLGRSSTLKRSQGRKDSSLGNWERKPLSRDSMRVLPHSWGWDLILQFSGLARCLSLRTQLEQVQSKFSVRKVQARQRSQKNANDNFFQGKLLSQGHVSRLKKKKSY